MNRVPFNFLILGLAFGLGPCLASCGPLLISYLAATGKDVRKSVLAYLLFSLSRVSIYAVLGLLVFLFGQLAAQYFFRSLTHYAVIIGAIFIVVIGLLIVLGRDLDDKFCRKVQGFFLKKDAKTIFIFGLIIAMLPCLPLISVLTYIGLVAKNWPESLAYSLFFGLGTTLSPLLVLAALSGLIPKVIEYKNRASNILRFICGLLIIFLGLHLLLKAFYA